MIENDRGGYADYTLALCRALVTSGVSLMYLSQSKSHPQDVDPFVCPILLARSPKRNMFGRLAFIFTKGLNAIRNIFRIRAYAIKHNADIIHFQVAMPFVYSYLIPLMLSRYILVMTVHDVFPHRRRGFFARPSHLGRLYAQFDYLITHSEINKLTLCTNFSVPEERVSVVPHGLTIAEHEFDKTSVRKMLGLPVSATLFLFLGTIRGNKGLDVLLRAFAMVASQNENCNLVIAGNPSRVNGATIKEDIARHPMHAKIFSRFEWLAEEVMEQYMVAADACVLPYTEFESQSGILSRAYANGVPIIASDVGSFRETIQSDQVGIICKPGIEADLVDAMLRFAASPELQDKFAENSRAAREKYSWDKVAKQTISLYKAMQRNRC